jgi:hypothetical protein
MNGPGALGELSKNERRLVDELQDEVESALQEGEGTPYVFEPASTGAGEFSDRVKRAVIQRAREAGWNASDLDEAGGFTVRKP